MKTFYSLGLLALVGMTSCTKTTQSAVATAETISRPAESASVLLSSFSAAEVQQLRKRMQESLVAVQYDGNTLRVLPECSGEGTYFLLETPNKEVTIGLDSPEEVQLNAPASATNAPRPAQLQAKILLTGRWTSTRSHIERKDLKGTCTQATHFVLRADAGLPMNSQQSPATCPTDAIPGDHACATPVRLHLQPLGASPAWDVARAMPSLACPADTFILEQKCATKRPKEAFACRLGEVDECNTQCERGNASSCNTLGWMTVRSSNLPSEIARAVGLFRRACEGGDVHGCAHAVLVSLSEHIDISGEDAVGLYEKSCARGDEESCLWLGNILEQASENKAMGHDFHMRACIGGSAKACGLRALVMENDPNEFRYALAFHRRACDDEYIPSCVRLGVLLRASNRGPAELEEGKKLFEMACARGDLDGCARLGIVYHSSTPEEQDYRKAGEYFEKACNGGLAYACRILGGMHENALGRTRDVARAAGLYAQGCSNGDAASCSELGRLHLTGEGILKDERRAAELFESACNGGLAVGCYNLALQCESGTGTAKDSKRAHDLHEKACRGGYTRSCRMLGMTPP